ncbi:MAG: DUF488 domain-containing protein [Micrococcales bacterium]|nr:DUF488 domain-containing protein [Micrococcales bacterium]
MPHLITFGHGRLDRGELGGLVAGAGIAQVVDVRRFPGSRSNPAAARGQVEEGLAEIGVGYRWEERLGGRRRLTKAEDEASSTPGGRSRHSGRMPRGRAVPT